MCSMGLRISIPETGSKGLAQPVCQELWENDLCRMEAQTQELATEWTEEVRTKENEA